VGQKVSPRQRAGSPSPLGLYSRLMSDADDDFCPRWPGLPWTACCERRPEAGPPCWATMSTTAGWRSAPLSYHDELARVGAGTGWLDVAEDRTWTGLSAEYRVDAAGFSANQLELSADSPPDELREHEWIRCSPNPGTGHLPAAGPGTSRPLPDRAAPAWRSGWPLFPGSAGGPAAFRGGRPAAQGAPGGPHSASSREQKRLIGTETGPRRFPGAPDELGPGEPGGRAGPRRWNAIMDHRRWLEQRLGRRRPG